VKKLLALFALSICPAIAQDHPVPESSIRHVTVINVVGGAELKDQTVKIQGNRIVSITVTQDPDASAPNSLDAHGAFLIPGLWDMHVHVHNTDELALYVANGVTGIRIMSGDKDEAGYRAELARVQPAPEIYLASAIVDGDPPVWPGSIVIKKPADARRAVDEIKASGADFIKVYNRIPRDAYFALAEEAKQQHIAFEGHVPDAITAQEASDAGQVTFEHLQGIGIACSSQQDVLMGSLNHFEFFLERLALEAKAYNSIDQSKCQALFAQLKRNNTWQVPTLTVRRLWGRIDDSHYTGDPRLAYIGKKSRDRWFERIQPQQRRWSNRDFQLARNIFATDEHVTGAMFHSGVPLMAGTDAMNPFCFPGFSLHDELAMLVESGLTPLAALQSATLNPATFLNRAAELGTIEPGKIANLVLLRSDPLADIHNTTQIQAVWLEGKYFDQAALTKLLEDVKLSAKH
jgi:hypothetical protein